MSADNGIYIAKFPTKDGQNEYRVIHAQAIENTDDESYVRNYFECAETFTSKEEAQKHAFKMEAEILSDDFCPILEYGISSMEFPKPLFDYPKSEEVS